MLTEEQQAEITAEMVKIGVPVRFQHNGRTIDIRTGQLQPKCLNVIHQHVYGCFTKETSLKIAKWLGVNAVFSR